MLQDNVILVMVSMVWPLLALCTAFGTAPRLILSRRSRQLIIAAAPLSLTDHAPSWENIEAQLLNTTIGRQLDALHQEQMNGYGPPSARARLRLMKETDPSNIRVTLYRDSACWCPYCQKAWILLEERRIPYRVKTVPLNAYGDKPAWYSQLVDGGKLPAMELDGMLYVESLDIMRVLESKFGSSDEEALDDARETLLFELEKRLQRDWFSLVFYPVEGEALEKPTRDFLDTMQLVDDALDAKSSPWFGGNLDEPSMMDIFYIPTMERIEASILYWRNIRLRGRFPNIDRWLQAWEERPTYMATKSDFYTLCLAMPSQNGPGYFSPSAKNVAAKIYGLDGAWDLGNENSLEPLYQDNDTARLESAYRLLQNHEAITEFCARAAGEPGRPAFHAELADPYAEPNEDYMPAIDVCLRHVANALVNGANIVEESASCDVKGICESATLLDGWEEYEEDDRPYFWNYETGHVTWTPPTGQLESCLAYLRNRVGVPRDMSFPAARQLRMHLNWAIRLMINAQY